MTNARRFQPRGSATGDRSESAPDPRRAIPRTDALLREPALADAASRLGATAVKNAIRAAQEQARAGLIAPDAVGDAALTALDTRSSLRPVLNATGVVVHTNLGRAPLSESAVAAVVAASGYTDLELDLDANQRVPRGEGVRRALLAAVPGAQDALVVNNGAAALVLAVTALAARSGTDSASPTSSVRWGGDWSRWVPPTAPRLAITP